MKQGQVQVSSKGTKAEPPPIDNRTPSGKSLRF